MGLNSGDKMVRDRLSKDEFKDKERHMRHVHGVEDEQKQKDWAFEQR